MVRVWPEDEWLRTYRRILLSRSALLTFSFLVVAALACIGHNVVRRRQAEAILTEIQQLRPGTSTMYEARRFASKHHMRSEPRPSDARVAHMVPCDDSEGVFSTEIEADRGIMLVAEKALLLGIKTTIPDELGLRYWWFRAWIEVHEGKVIGTGVSVFIKQSLPNEPYWGWSWHTVSTAFGSHIPDRAVDSAYARATLENTPGYLTLRRPKNFEVFIAPEADPRYVGGTN